jgi:hypothetical protein
MMTKMSPRWMSMLGRHQRIELRHVDVMLFLIPSSCDAVLWRPPFNLCLGHHALHISALPHPAASLFYYLPCCSALRPA